MACGRPGFRPWHRLAPPPSKGDGAELGSERTDIPGITDMVGIPRKCLQVDRGRWECEKWTGSPGPFTGRQGSWPGASQEQEQGGRASERDAMQMPQVGVTAPSPSLESLAGTGPSGSPVTAPHPVSCVASPHCFHFHTQSCVPIRPGAQELGRVSDPRPGQGSHSPSIHFRGPCLDSGPHS